MCAKQTHTHTHNQTKRKYNQMATDAYAFHGCSLCDLIEFLKNVIETVFFLDKKNQYNSLWDE